MISIYTTNRAPWPYGHQGGDDAERKCLMSRLPVDEFEVHHSQDTPHWDYARHPVDVVTAFNLGLSETSQAELIAAATGAKFVIFPILTRGFYCGGPDRCRQVVQRADALCFNLKEEPYWLAEDLKLSPEEVLAKSYLVPVGAPEDWYLASPNYEKVPREPYVILSARYEGRKQQVPFLHAWLDCRCDEWMPLYLLGDERNPIFTECQQLAEGHPNVHVLGAVPHEDMMHWFSGARVSVLPSTYDTPGMSNLEGAITGCEVVATGIPAITQYLSNYAWYGEAGFPLSHVIATIRAWQHAEARLAYTGAAKNSVIAAYIRSHFSWQYSANKLADVYRAVLSGQVVPDTIFDTGVLP